MCHSLVTLLLVCCPFQTASDPPTAAKSKSAKLPSALKLVTAAYRLLDQADPADLAAAAGRLRESKQLVGRRGTLTASVVSLDRQPSGVLLKATLRRPRGPEARYMTDAERAKLAALTAARDRAKQDRFLALSHFVQRIAESKRPLSNESRRWFERERTKILRKHEAVVRKAEVALQKSAKQFRSAAAARKTACETIDLTVALPAKADLAAIAAAGKIKLSARLADFELGREPSEIGGGVRIKSLSVDNVKVLKLLGGPAQVHARG